MAESRLKIARKKKGLTQRQAAAVVGITPQAWSSAERGRTKLHRNNLERVAKKFDVSLSWLITGEGNETISMPEDIGKGKFVRILSAHELLTGEEDESSRHVFVPDLEDDAIGYITRADLPSSIVQSVLIAVPADFKSKFENGKWYLLVIEGLLIIRKVEKVIFGTNKGSFKLTDFGGAVDFVDGKGIKAWRVIWRLDELG